MVKLFWLIKILFEIFWSKVFCCRTNSCVKNIFSTKTFLGQNKIWTKKVLGQRRSWVRKLWSQKSFSQISFLSENFWVKKTLNKKVLVQEFLFWKYYWYLWIISSKKGLGPTYFCIKMIWVLIFCHKKVLVGLKQGGGNWPPSQKKIGLKLCWDVVRFVRCGNI